MLQRRLATSGPIALILGSFVLFVLDSAVASEAADRASLYELVVQTSMPHLEENLRYTKTTSTKCLTRSALFVAFPVLGEDAFDECRLERQAPSENDASYRLVCPISSGTTGIAIWRLGTSDLAGVLEVKLGGKNMTFHQRITAKRIGQCPP
jgi:hypothetical protein